MWILSHSLTQTPGCVARQVNVGKKWTCCAVGLAQAVQFPRSHEDPGIFVWAQAVPFPQKPPCCFKTESNCSMLCTLRIENSKHQFFNFYDLLPWRPRCSSPPGGWVAHALELWHQTWPLLSWKKQSTHPSSFKRKLSSIWSMCMNLISP